MVKNKKSITRADLVTMSDQAIQKLETEIFTEDYNRERAGKGMDPDAPAVINAIIDEQERREEQRKGQ